MRVLVTLATIACLRPTTASAQSTCDTGKPDKVVTVVTPSAGTIPTPGVAEFNAGSSESVSYNVSVTPQVGGFWLLCLVTFSANAGTVNGYTKPITDFEFSMDGTTWTPFSTTPVLVYTAKGALTVTVFVRSRLSYALDQPLSATTPALYGPVSFEIKALF